MTLFWLLTAAAVVNLGVFLLNRRLLRQVEDAITAYEAIGEDWQATIDNWRVERVHHAFAKVQKTERPLA